MQSKPLSEFIQSSETLAHLQAHASRLLRLQRAYEEIAPPQLARSSRIANFKAGVVLIHAANGAAAAKLNQLIPRFVDAFVNEGFDLTGIEVRLQVSALQQNAPTRRPRPVTARSREALGRLADTLPEDSPLRGALAGFRRENAE